MSYVMLFEENLFAVLKQIGLFVKKKKLCYLDWWLTHIRI